MNQFVAYDVHTAQLHYHRARLLLWYTRRSEHLCMYVYMHNYTRNAYAHIRVSMHMHTYAYPYAHIRVSME